MDVHPHAATGADDRFDRTKTLYNARKHDLCRVLSQMAQNVSRVSSLNVP